MAFTERHIENLDELFQVLRLSNVSEFGDQTISPWVFRGQPDADFPLVPKLWRDGFLDNPAFSARKGLLFRMVDDALSNLGPSRWSEQPERARGAAKRLIIEHVLMKNFYSLASDVVGLDRVQIASISELLRLNCTSLFRFTDSYWRAMPLAQHYGIPTRLLDWTFDPLTALYFSVADEINDAERATVWCLDKEALLRENVQSGSLGRPHNYDFWGPHDVRNVYMQAQRGAFTFVPNGDHSFISTGEYPTIERLASPGHMKRLTFAGTRESKLLIMSRLFRERRTQAHLMPDLPHCAELAWKALASGLHITM